MKYQINREEPVVPPVTDIVLTVSPEELIHLLRSVGHIEFPRLSRQVPGEKHNLAMPKYADDLYSGLRKAAVDAGLVYEPSWKL